MRALYAVAREIDAARVNLIAGAGVLSLTNIAAAVMTGEAFRLFMERSARVVDVTGVIMVYHSGRAYKEVVETKNGARVNLLCRIKGATQFDAGDRSSNASGPVNAEQPLALGSVRISLCFQLKTPAFADDILPLFEQFMWERARFAGGEITGIRDLSIQDSFDGALEALGHSGFIVTDQTALTIPYMEKNRVSRAEAMTSLVFDVWPRKEAQSKGDEGQTEDDEATEPQAPPPPEQQNRFRSFACLGYNLLTPPESRIGARENLPHAFAEAMIGIVELTSLGRLRKARRTTNEDGSRLESREFNDLGWTYSWPSEDIFLIHHIGQTA